MKVTVITSFNEKYYNLIGKYCISSWLLHWPTDVELICYVEDCKIEEHDRIQQIPFTELGDSYFNFQNSNHKARVKTFAKKAYSIIHAMENVETDFLIWIDADVLTFNKIDNDFLTFVKKQEYLATFMGVLHHRYSDDPTSELMFSCESSFFVLNKNHEQFKNFSKRYREYYDLNLTENLRRFYDGEVLGATIKDFENKALMRDLNPENAYKTPMPRTFLKEYITHFKAGLKDKEDLDTEIEKIIGKNKILKISSF